MSRTEFDRFVAESSAGLLRAAYLIVRDLQEAEDLVQETMFKVARRWPTVSCMDHPVAYARRILVNLALDGRPKRSLRRAELSDPHLPEPAALAAVAVDSHDDLYVALAAPAGGARPALLPGSSRSRGDLPAAVLPRDRQEHGFSSTRAT